MSNLLSNWKAPNWIARLSCVIIVLASITVAHAADRFKEGVDYELLKNPGQTQNADKIEVREFFWFGCPHCFALQPAVAKWREDLPADVEFVGAATAMNPRWENHAKAYYIAKLTGTLDEIEPALFDALHVKKKKLQSEDQLADFFSDYGVSTEKFHKLFDSFPIETQVKSATKLSGRYQLTGVPAIIVNGKYLAKPPKGKEPGAILEVVDFLIEKEREGTKS